MYFTVTFDSWVDVPVQTEHMLAIWTYIIIKSKGSREQNLWLFPYLYLMFLPPPYPVQNV